MHTMSKWNMLVKKQPNKIQQNINIICKYLKSTGMRESLLLKCVKSGSVSNLFIEISVPKRMVN